MILQRLIALCSRPDCSDKIETRVPVALHNAVLSSQFMSWPVRVQNHVKYGANLEGVDNEKGSRFSRNLEDRGWWSLKLSIQQIMKKLPLRWRLGKPAKMFSTFDAISLSDIQPESNNPARPVPPAIQKPSSITIPNKSVALISLIT